MINQFASRNSQQPPDDEDATPQDAFDARQNGKVNEADLLAAQELVAV